MFCYLIPMRHLPLFVLFAFMTSASADERKIFHDTWGTAQQCARKPIKSGGTVLAQPFEIGAQWLKQGRLWCKLNWGPIEARDGGFFTGANAQCGEDSLRGYFISMRLTNDKLTLRWDFPVSNGPLSRCN